MSSHRSSQVSPRLAAEASSAVNVTVDDEYGDQNSHWAPQFLPLGGWSQGAQCVGCALNSTFIDTGRVMNASWHDTTYYPGNKTREISIDFVGTAVYVYHIIVNRPPNPLITVFTNLSFLIDNAIVGNYTHSLDPDGPPVLYDVPVYVNRNLTNEKHTLRIQSGGPNITLVLFDYIQYTVNTSSTPSQSSSSSQPGSLASLSPPTTSTPSPTHTQPASSTAARLSPGIIAAIAISLGLTAALVLIIALIIRSRARGKSHKAAEEERQPIVVPFQERQDPSTSFGLSQASGTAVSRSLPPASPTPFPPPRTPAYHARRPPPRHWVDVPAPALSVTGTERSLRYMELVEELAALETMVKEVEEAARPTRLRTAGATSEPEPGERYTPRHPEGRRLASIRLRMKRVRALIEDERRLMEEALPRSQR
ncbi:hypothetical protein OH76DRAFT_1248519 [Lentinus brumalis]|uniref:Uncharacterized protein n=1 Tax=Lentinus brumalis TaxID=2498619 RepID=A0A371CRN9_9APHY|nr:hypothetical protein OH76DRAFT_1248519 [Polyporus brumalis]